MRRLQEVHCELSWSSDFVHWHRIDEGHDLVPLGPEGRCRPTPGHCLATRHSPLATRPSPLVKTTPEGRCLCLCITAAVPLLDTPVHRSLTALGIFLYSASCSFESHICYGSVPLEDAVDKTIVEYYFGGDGPQ